VIQKALQDPLAELLLSGEVMDGETVPVHVGVDGLIIGEPQRASKGAEPEEAVAD